MNRTLLARCLQAAALAALLGCPAHKGDTDAASEEPDAGDDAGASCEEPAPVDKVDILLVIDNSSGMAFPQKKLAAALPRFVSSLADTPIQSAHIGMVTTDMGINGAPARAGCGERSLPPIYDQRRDQPVNKPTGDDGMLQVDTSVASDGLWAPRIEDSMVVEVAPADPACADVQFPHDARFVDFNVGDDPDDAAHQLACISKRGLNGCRLRQPLEAALKALTPPNSSLKFMERSPDGHGNASQPGEPSGYNQNFLREDALLVVVIVTNGADCSSPSRDLFDPDVPLGGALYVRCGFREHENLLYPLTRYSEGFAAVKPRERMIFAALTGIPLATRSGSETHSGWTAMDTILAMPDMQFQVTRLIDDEPVPTCISKTDDTQAAPGRRYLELLGRTFKGNSLVSSLCEDDYTPFFTAMTEKIVGLLASQPSCAQDAGR